MPTATFLRLLTSEREEAEWPWDDYLLHATSRAPRSHAHHLDTLAALHARATGPGGHHRNGEHAEMVSFAGLPAPVQATSGRAPLVAWPAPCRAPRIRAGAEGFSSYRTCCTGRTLSPVETELDGSHSRAPRPCWKDDVGGRFGPWWTCWRAGAHFPPRIPRSTRRCNQSRSWALIPSPRRGLVREPEGPAPTVTHVLNPT
jgi:hypothetical protein